MNTSPVAINYFHVAGVAPMLGYIAYENYNGRPIAPTLTILLAIIAIIIVIYHSYLAMQKTAKISAMAEVEALRMRKSR